MADERDELIRPIPALDTNEHAINLVRAEVEKLRTSLEARPAYNATMLSTAYTTWKHRFLIQLGICYGNLQAGQAFGFIGVEQFMQLKTQIMGFTVRLAEPVEMGTDGP